MSPAVKLRKFLVPLVGVALLAGWVRPAPASAAPTATLLADARVAAASPSSNYGGSSTLEVDSSPLTESFLAFSVSGVDGPVSSARLRAWVKDSSANGPVAYLSVSGWNESGITWNNKPARTSGPLANAGKVSSGTWVEWDVTAAVGGNGVYSFNLVADSSDGTDLASREAGSNRPQLVVAVGSTPPPSSAASPGHGRHHHGGGHGHRRLLR
jgi:hypothetical protein